MGRETQEVSAPLPQDDRKGGLSLRGVAFMTVLAVLAVLESTLLVLQNTVPRDDRDGFWRFRRFRRLWRFRS